MKKNFKVLSSLALAGMLTTGVLGTSLAATDSKDVTSKVPGIYNELIATTKNVLPIILANSNDIATIRDIKESGLFKAAALEGLNESKQLRTGDTFKANGKEYTVVIFGDVDKNGNVNVLDALEIAKYVKGLPNKLADDAIASVMGNVKRADKSGVNILDALRIQRFVLGQQPDGIIDEIPQEESKQSNYTLSTKDQYINNQNDGSNATTFDVEVEVAEKLEENKTLTLKITGPDGTALAPIAVSIAKNEISKLVPVDLSSITDNGTVKFELYEGATIADDAEPVDTCEVERKVEVPVAAKVSATRDNTREASMSLENVAGKAEIAEIHFAIVENGDSAPATTALTNKLPVKGNKNLKLTDKLEKEGQAYDVYYQLVDVYGNVSTSVEGPVVIASSSNVLAADPVTKIEVPDLKTSTDFTITTKGATDIVIVDLYKDGKLILETEKTAVGSSVSYDFKAEMASASLDYEAGTYSIKVATKEASNGSTTRSEEKASDSVTVKALNPVKDITSKYIEVDPSVVGDKAKIEVSWTDANTASEEDATTPYEVLLQKYDETTKKYVDVRANTPETTVDVANKKIVFTIDSADADGKIVANEMYKVVITTKALASQDAIIDSQAVESPAFYAIDVGAVTANGITDKSVTLNLANEVKVAGKAVTKYKVDIYPYAMQMGTNNTQVEVRGTTTTKNVELVDGKIVIDGLQPDTRYEFKLFADVDGVTGESALITADTNGNDIKTLKTTPAITECKIVNNADKATNKTIYFPSANEVWINGTTKITDYTQGYSQEFQDMLAVIKQLNVNDVVTVSSDGITLKLEEADATAINLGTTAEGMKLTVEGTAKKERAVQATANTKGPKEIVVKGNNTILNTDGLNAEKITLTNGVEVRNATNARTYTIAKNTTVIINGISVKTGAEEVSISGTGKALTVNVDEINSDLAFENLNDTRFTTLGTAATITLNGEKNSSYYKGTISINSLGGTVAVSQSNHLDTSKANLKVNVTDATITVADDFTSKVNMTVAVDADEPTSKSELIVTPKEAMPTIASVSLTGLEIKNYANKDALETALKALTANSAVATTLTITQTDYENIMKFLNSFEMSSKELTGATIEDNNSNVAGTVKITFTKSVSNLDVAGLK